MSSMEVDMGVIYVQDFAQCDKLDAQGLCMYAVWYV